MRINLFYIVVLLLGLSLFVVLKPKDTTELSFFGFAQSNETEINYNYPVVVEDILVLPGQAVQEKDTLMLLSRRKSKERLDEQRFRIASLKAKNEISSREMQGQLSELILNKRNKLNDFDLQISKIQNEINYKKSIVEGLKSVSPSSYNYRPLEEEMTQLISEKKKTEALYNLKIEQLNQKISIEHKPNIEEIKRLSAEQAFEEDQIIQYVYVFAPSDGLIGNISCKEEEHIPAYRSLLTFYEPHSGIIKGFVHENLTLSVRLDDEFIVSSLKDPEIQYQGKVIGLGSRIVEIPNRLRKIEDVRTYGREILIEIDRDNGFLQKEKVGIRFISSPNRTE